MREIKFRVWNKRNAIMVLWEDVKRIFTDQGFGISDGSSVHYENIMQFTGLKDKNGKEIYEADVLQSYPLGDTKFIVGYGVNDGDNNYGWILESCRNAGTYGFDMSVEKMEVIGNIYENPEIAVSTEKIPGGRK